MTRAAGEIFPDDPPLFLARTPHGHFDTDKTCEELDAAEFRDIEVATFEARSTAPDPSYPAIAYCRGTPLCNEILERDPAGLGKVTQAATEAIRSRFGAGPVDGLVRGFVFSATA